MAFEALGIRTRPLFNELSTGFATPEHEEGRGHLDTTQPPEDNRCERDPFAGHAFTPSSLVENSIAPIVPLPTSSTKRMSRNLAEQKRLEESTVTALLCERQLGLLPYSDATSRPRAMKRTRDSSEYFRHLGSKAWQLRQKVKVT